MLQVVFIIVCAFFCIGSFLPLVDSKHWFFRAFDYVKIQIIYFLAICLILSFVIDGISTEVDLAIKVALVGAIIYNTSIIFPFISFSKNEQDPKEHSITLLSYNVKQDNTQYGKLVDLVLERMPDILLTTEMNKTWEEAIKDVEKKFKYCIKIPKDNKYGMHLYTNLELKDYTKHHLITEEYPSIEAKMVDKKGEEFILWSIHPPPPSPTEEITSKKKDAELMKLALQISKEENPVLVAGDFNNVCWSQSSKHFSKVSNLEDARIGRGLHGTFPSFSSLLRFPIDLIYYSKNIDIININTLEAIGSDHLPLQVTFFLNEKQRDLNKVEPQLKKKAREIIKEGIKEVNA